jgi:hypothetical protein
MTPDKRTTHLNPADQPNSTPDPGGNEQIDNYLRQSLNIAWVKLQELDEPSALTDAKAYLAYRLRIVGPWPDSPQPEAFPFVQKGGIQEGE